MNPELLSVIVGQAIMKCYVHPVTFQMVFKPLNLFKYIIQERLANMDINIEVLEDVKWDTICFEPSITSLTVFSECNGNDDNRGGGCGELKIPVSEFTYTINNSNGITLRDLTECVYRMKGSKYDWWYELYGSVVVTDRTVNSVTVSVDFDYGS